MACFLRKLKQRKNNKSHETAPNFSAANSSIVSRCGFSLYAGSQKLSWGRGVGVTANHQLSHHREISIIEKEIVQVAEAMPEDKFHFSPEKLNISGSDYKVCAPSAGN